MRNSPVPTLRSGPDLLSSDFLAQLERLALLSRRAFRGRVRGERRSPRKGISVEFSDYRPYGVGDDIRYVDWNVYARLDRLYLKLFVDEEDLCLHLLVDASASMEFGEPSKLDYAARLAAGLGFVGLVNLERVGVGVLRERIAEGFSPARGRSGRAGLGPHGPGRLRARPQRTARAELRRPRHPRPGRRRGEPELRRRPAPDRRRDGRGAGPHARRRGAAGVPAAAAGLP